MKKPQTGMNTNWRGRPWKPGQVPVRYQQWSLTTMADTLLTREAFTEAVLARSGGTCVICGMPAVDAHHIMERRLFPDGGYYLGNGAALCEEHHLAAEMTILSVEEIRKACGIPEAKKVLPPAYYPDEQYDKCGNVIMNSGFRMRGELFDDPSVRKILGQGGVLSQFSYYVKYPRTWHLPWSQNIRSDDRVLTSADHFRGEEVVVTIRSKLLFQDEELPTARNTRDAVKPAQTSPAAKAKKVDRETSQGLPVQSLENLLKHLARRTRNRCRVASQPEGSTFTQVSDPTPLQKRAMELLDLYPGQGN
jgi:hypothetical protein